MTGTTASVPRARLGRARFGGGPAALLIASALIGLGVAAGLGALFAWLGDSGEAWLRFVVMAVVSLPVAAALGWVLLVDRSSLADAIERPEDTVESAWMQRAAEGTVRDVFVTVSLGAAIFSITGLQLDTGLLLLGVAVLLVVDLGVRYLRVKRADA